MAAYKWRHCGRVKIVGYQAIALCQLSEENKIYLTNENIKTRKKHWFWLLLENSTLCCFLLWFNDSCFYWQMRDLCAVPFCKSCTSLVIVISGSNFNLSRDGLQNVGEQTAGCCWYIYDGKLRCCKRAVLEAMPSYLEPVARQMLQGAWCRRSMGRGQADLCWVGWDDGCPSIQRRVTTHPQHVQLRQILDWLQRHWSWRFVQNYRNDAKIH